MKETKTEIKSNSYPGLSESRPQAHTFPWQRERELMLLLRNLSINSDIDGGRGGERTDIT